MPEQLKQTIARITKMEQLFDHLLLAVSSAPDTLRTDPKLRAALSDLTKYYQNGQWLADYTCDELGALPPGFKRGVLSQDALYDLLCDIDRLSAHP